MRTFSIITTGRTGSDYLNACLDGMNEVMTFCGKFDYTVFFEGPDHKVDKEELIDAFLKKYSFLFSNNKFEHTNLEIDVNTLKKIFINLNLNSKLNRKEFLIDIYKSYHLILNRSVENAKVLIFHSHNIALTKKFLKDFPDTKLLITVRDPRANLKSGIINWQDYDPSKVSIEQSYHYLKRVREDLKFLLKKINNEKLFVKLEEANNKETKDKITSFLDVSYDEKIYTATLGSKVWPGDVLSKEKSKKGEYIKSAVDNGWKIFFSSRDLILLNEIFKEYIKFGYTIPILKWPKKILFLFYTFFPMDFEKKTFEKIKNKKFNDKVLNYFSFMKRIIYFLLIFFKLEIFIPNKRHNITNIK